MARSWFIPASLAVFAFVLWLTTFIYQSSYINRTIITIIGILMIYIVFRVLLEDRIIKNFTSTDKRYCTCLAHTCFLRFSHQTEIN